MSDDTRWTNPDRFPVLDATALTDAARVPLYEPSAPESDRQRQTDLGSLRARITRPRANTLLWETCRRDVTVATNALDQPSSGGPVWQAFPNHGVSSYSDYLQWRPEGFMRFGGGNSGDDQTRFYLLDHPVAGARLVEAVLHTMAQNHWGVRLCLAYLDPLNHLTVRYAASLSVVAVVNGVATSLINLGSGSTSLDYPNSFDVRRVWGGVYGNHTGGSESGRHIRFGMQNGITGAVGLSIALRDLFFGATPSLVGVGGNSSECRMYEFQCDQVRDANM